MHRTLPFVTLIALGAVACDSADTPARDADTDTPQGDTSADTGAPDDTADTSAPDDTADTGAPDDAADTDTPDDTADTSAPDDTTDTSAPDDAADTSDAADAEVVVPPGPALVALAAGAGTTCAVLDDGTARCWGDNREGQLGDGSDVDGSVTPVAVVDLDDAVAISAGYEFACALRAGGTVVCWGSGANGRLGNGASDDAAAPVAVADLSGVVAVQAGYSTACALKGDETVWCWGRGGDLGRTDLTESAVPVQVPGLADVVQLANASHGGTSYTSHVCGARGDGTAFCWGHNPDGQNGTGTQDVTRTPAEVLGLDDVSAITAGLNHACAVRADGTACWGASQLIGDGSVERRFTATPVATAARFTTLTAGFDHTCGLTADGDVWCWGRNGHGQIGDGEPLVVGDVRLTPVRADVADVVLVAAGMSHTCAHTADARTWCWGENAHGELGWGTPGSFERSNVPTAVVW